VVGETCVSVWNILIAWPGLAVEVKVGRGRDCRSGRRIAFQPGSGLEQADNWSLPLVAGDESCWGPWIVAVVGRQQHVGRTLRHAR